MGKGHSGGIPRDTGNLTELQVPSLGENTLNGMIPKSIAKLKKLWLLDLESGNRLLGLQEGIVFKSKSLEVHFKTLSASKRFKVSSTGADRSEIVRV